MDHTRHYVAQPSSLWQVRQFVRALVVPAGADVMEGAVLAANEIASNAVDHAQTEYDVRVIVGEAAVRIEVSDGSSMEPAVQHPSVGDERGRGMQIVEKLTSRWGVTSCAAGGKVVWFEIDR